MEQNATVARTVISDAQDAIARLINEMGSDDCD
jgi:hypothetical protein